MRILVIQQKMIGDVLASTVICETLRKEHPDATIDYLVYSNTKAVIKNNPFFDNIIEFKQEYRNNKKAFYLFLKQIRKQRYSIVIDAFGKLESNLISLFSNAPKRISFYKWYTQLIYTEVVYRKANPLTNASTAIENRLRLVLPEHRIASEIVKPKIFLDQEEKARAKEFLESNGIHTKDPLIMISVLGSEKRKTLPFDAMAKVIDEIVSTTAANILFNYIPDQEKDAKTIYDLTLPRTQQRIHFNVYAKSLRGFIAILSCCNALIGNEGGAVNMAKALELSTFTIFSPWIIKKDWNMFEDGIDHDSIHLADVKPELYSDGPSKKMKDQSLELYQQFSAESIIRKLRGYLAQNFE
ncbi:glycosyltransferase family 9 protein [Aquimarina sp. AU474]|uniref:glycosyltransferase family 9 protein n=1 Tax=Aquimarina sp. AU474 TaxID=2108529 RepID=UPI000D691DBA|nr:glycosyltransferase family 9 protein [Aquimarina sp. AU474]